MCERWHQLTQLLARLTAAELGADRQDFSVPWLHTAGAVTGFVLNAGALRRDRKCRLSALSQGTKLGPDGIFGMIIVQLLNCTLRWKAFRAATTIKT